MIKLFSYFILLLTFVITANSAPSTISYTGKLYESGSAVNGSRNMSFTIYDASTNGNLLWTSGSYSVTVTNGLYSVLLGSNSDAITASVFNGNNTYLQVVVEATTLTPRVKFNAVPYSYRASVVDDASITPSKLSGISSNGTSGQELISLGDGTFGWNTSNVLSTQVATVAANAVTVTPTTKLIRVNSDNNSVDDVLTLTAGAEGQLLYIYYYNTTGDVEWLTLGGADLTSTNTIKPVIFINGAWRLYRIN